MREGKACEKGQEGRQEIGMERRQDKEKDGQSAWSQESEERLTNYLRVFKVWFSFCNYFWFKYWFMLSLTIRYGFVW